MTSITPKHKKYPEMLKEIHQPPQILFCEGSLPTGPAVAVVGSRKPTMYGQEMTYRIAYDLARAGLVIVSGLAMGIDGIAHQAALEAGGLTIAVMGTGLDVIYPSRHRALARQIVAGGGALVTEYKEGMTPRKHHFPARNRIIAGLSLGVLVPEADARSGSLITAWQALDENRTVMAVPGNVTSQRSAGPNNLLKAGATPVTCAEDVWTALGLVMEPAASPVIPVQRPGLEGELLDLLAAESLATDVLASRLERPVPALLSALSLLELTGEIRSLGGGVWMRVDSSSTQSTKFDKRVERPI